MASRIPLLAGNWKMNLDHLEATYFVQKLVWLLRDARFDYSRCEIALMPSFTSLRSVQVLVEADKLKIRYGAQAVSVTTQGAFTGDVSADMIAHLGCSYVIVGHSERRKYHPEDDVNIVDQVRAVLAAGMQPILCVGESFEERRQGIELDFAVGQVHDVTRDLSDKEAAKLIIAYEPVWAIGTGMVATPEHRPAGRQSHPRRPRRDVRPRRRRYCAHPIRRIGVVQERDASDRRAGCRRIPDRRRVARPRRIGEDRPVDTQGDTSIGKHAHIRTFFNALRYTMTQYV